MIEGPLADEIRAVSHFGCRALEGQVLAIGRALKRQLKPAERSMLRRECDKLASRLVVWRTLVSHEPQIVAELETLAQKLQELQPRAARGPRVIRPAAKAWRVFPHAVDRRRMTV